MAAGRFFFRTLAFLKEFLGVVVFLWYVEEFLRFLGLFFMVLKYSLGITVRRVVFRKNFVGCFLGKPIFTLFLFFCYYFFLSL
jgi:hypothetical protein